ncbi:MAG: pyruvate kinase alpha/beta domain-containing protein, partial [Aeromonas veronii]
LKDKGLLQSGDMVLLTHGDKMETVGSTNTCKVMMVE